MVEEGFTKLDPADERGDGLSPVLTPRATEKQEIKPGDDIPTDIYTIMVHIKKQFVLILILLMAMNISAQELPFRIGAKVGLPIIAGLEAEFVTPVSGYRLAFMAEASYVPYTHTQGDFSGTFTMKYGSLGANFYLFRERNGKGPYLHLGLGRWEMDVKGTQEASVKASDNSILVVKEEVTTGFTTAVFITGKVGFKIGNAFYLRTEIGFSGYKLPETIEYTTHYSVTDPADGSLISETKEHSIGFEFPMYGGPVIQLGIGIAF